MVTTSLTEHVEAVQRVQLVYISPAQDFVPKISIPHRPSICPKHFCLSTILQASQTTNRAILLNSEAIQPSFSQVLSISHIIPSELAYPIYEFRKMHHTHMHAHTHTQLVEAYLPLNKQWCPLQTHASSLQLSRHGKTCPYHKHFVTFLCSDQFWSSIAKEHRRLVFFLGMV